MSLLVDCEDVANSMELVCGPLLRKNWK